MQVFKLFRMEDEDPFILHVKIYLICKSYKSFSRSFRFKSNN